MDSNAAVLRDGQPRDKRLEGFSTTTLLLGIRARKPEKNPATRNRTRDHLIAAAFYSQMLYQLSYSRLVIGVCGGCGLTSAAPANRDCGTLAQASDLESESPSTSSLLPEGCQNAETRDRTGDLQIFSLTLSQLSYRGGWTLTWCEPVGPLLALSEGPESSRLKGPEQFGKSRIPLAPSKLKLWKRMRRNRWLTLASFAGRL